MADQTNRDQIARHFTDLNQRLRALADASRDCPCEPCRAGRVYARLTAIAAGAVADMVRGDTRAADILVGAAAKITALSAPPAPPVAPAPSQDGRIPLKFDLNLDGPTTITVPGHGQFVITPVRGIGDHRPPAPAAPVVVDGHHRAEVARRAAEEPPIPAPRVRARKPAKKPGKRKAA
jgi:hypothetical protein